jgi:hypothetical protein
VAFTSPELVRTHLSNVRLGEIAVADVPVTLSGTAAVQLPHAGLVESSVVVKCRRSQALMRESLALGSSWVNLSHTRLVPGSVVIASDTSLSTIYHENIDYLVDHPGGRVRRIDGGAIGNGQTVVIWYDHYHVFTPGDDYTVDAPAGQLARRSGGLIADGQEVLVDYTVALGAVTETVIAQAIGEAGEAVLAFIHEGYQEQPTPAIVIGATHWAVAAVARMRAAATLADAGVTATVARAAAQTWLEVASRYEESGRAYLARFAAPLPSRRAIGLT